MRPTKAIINLSAIQHNLLMVRQLAPKCKVLAVIKADGYGHGIVPVAKALKDADSLAVACMDEAIKLREAKIKNSILLLEGFYDEIELQQVFEYDLETVIHQQQQVDALLAHSSSFQHNKKIKIWLKLDTGMNRLGFNQNTYQLAYHLLSQCPLVESVKLMSHLACADDINNPMNLAQIDKFNKANRDLSGDRSMANSAGIIAWPESHFEWIRPGIALFGCSPMLDINGLSHQLLPAMTLKSKVIAIHDIKAGETVGYGASWKAKRDTRVGVIAIGYGDGYPRHANEGTPVFINGNHYPLIGKVSMDMLTVDLGTDQKILVGDEVILWGENLCVETIASHANTIPYTLLCGVTSRVNFEWT